MAVPPSYTSSGPVPTMRLARPDMSGARAVTDGIAEVAVAIAGAREIERDADRRVAAIEDDRALANKTSAAMAALYQYKASLDAKEVEVAPRMATTGEQELDEFRQAEREKFLSTIDDNRVALHVAPILAQIVGGSQVDAMRQAARGRAEMSVNNADVFGNTVATTLRRKPGDAEKATAFDAIDTMVAGFRDIDDGTKVRLRQEFRQKAAQAE